MKRNQLSLMLAFLLMLTVFWANAENIADQSENQLECVEVDLSDGMIQGGSLDGPRTLPDEPVAYSTNTLYDAIYQGLLNRETEIDISGVRLYVEQIDILNTEYLRVVNDHPELFYVRTWYSYAFDRSTGVLISIRPEYFEGLPSNAWQLFDEEVQKALAQVDDSMTPLEKALVLHDYLILHCEYNWDVHTGVADPPISHSAYGALVTREPVCQGYSLAYKYLLNLVGVPCGYASSDPMKHIWNLIQLDGEWYHVDVTWDDPVINVEGFCRHTFFLISDETMRDSVHAHKGWVSENTCTSQKYEAGYNFCELDAPMWYWDGNFYFAQVDWNTWNYVLYSGDLEGALTEETRVPVVRKSADGGYSSVNTQRLMVDGDFYYVDGDCATGPVALKCYNVDTGREKTAGTFFFTAAPSPDGRYSEESDSIGLRYRDGKIQAVSSTRRSVLGQFEPVDMPDYPPAWDIGSGTRIAGVQGNKVGVVVEQGSAMLWVASYSANGKMIGLEAYPVQAQPQVIVLTLSQAAQGTVHRKLFLATKTGVPLCESYTTP